jgi:glycerophosphoryl diester phosphodiesterase
MAFAHGLGADYIEQDIVLSRDGVAMVLHDIHLESTTNVSRVFPDRARADGRYYAIDFTAAELKRLEVFERLDDSGNTVFTNRFPSATLGLRIPTLAEAIVLIEGLNKSRQKNAGLYIELKAPSFHRQSGWDIAKVIIEVLEAYGLNTPEAPVFLQCFDAATLRYLNDDLRTPLPLIQLIGDNSWGDDGNNNYDLMRTDAGLQAIAEYAEGIGPWIPQLFDDKYPRLSERARGQSLLVHPFTLRADQFEPFDSFTSLQHRIFIEERTDGAFTDFPDVTRQFIDSHFPNTTPGPATGTE